MTPVIRVDDEVHDELKKRAVELGLVFEPPNSTLRNILGLDKGRFGVTVGSSSEEGGLKAPAKEIKHQKGEGMIVKAATLVINAPFYQGGKRSFDDVIKTGIGQGYIIYPKDLSKLQIPGAPLVLLSKDEKRRAEGNIIDIQPTCKSPSGKQRYDVSINNLIEVGYKDEKLNHCGVAII